MRSHVPRRLWETSWRDEEHAEECNLFKEEFLKHLLVLVDAANKTVRSRACQLIARMKFSLLYKCPTLAYLIITQSSKKL